MCKKNCTKNWTECSLVQHGFLIRFVSSVCLLVRVTTVDKNNAVVCRLLTTSAIMLSEKKKRKRKMWSKKCYLKRNISRDAHVVNELLETDVPWDDAIVVSAVGFPGWTAHFSVWTILERTILRPALLPLKTAQFTQFFPQVWRHTIAQFSWDCIGPVWTGGKSRPYRGSIPDRPAHSPHTDCATGPTYTL